MKRMQERSVRADRAGAIRARATVVATYAVMCGLWMMLPVSLTHAATFGEIALSVGGNYPQEGLTRYANPSFTVNARATIHVPGAAVIVGWMDGGFTPFSSEVIKAQIPVVGGLAIPVNQTTSESEAHMHVGLQLASPTRRGLFRPRVAAGIGPYFFSTRVSWKTEIGDTSLTLATETLDEQVRFGWRGLVGLDLFIKPQWGVTAEFVYDQVFGLNQREGVETSERVARFQGFTVGLIYMFKTSKR